MNVIAKYKKEIVASFGIFIVFIIMSFLYRTYNTKESVKIFVNQTIKDNTVLLHTVQNELNKKADIIFDIKVNQPHVLELMAEANDLTKRAEVRKKLYTLLLPTYKLLQQNGIRQFHFHLPENISLLRFHKPEKFGDSLEGIRYSIEKVNKTKQIVRGFEEGRIFNGFRNVYPLFYHKKFIGTVEISYSIRAIAEVLEVTETEFYGLLIQKKLVDKKVWKVNHKYYVDSQLSQQYLWDKKAFETLHKEQNEMVFMKKLHLIEKKLSDDFKLHSNKKDFIIPFKYEKEPYIAIFHILKNVQNSIVGYIVSFKKNQTLSEIKFHEYKDKIITFILSLLVAILFFLFLKKEKDIKELLEEESNYDLLTQILNRRGFETTFNPLFEAHKRKAKPFSLLFLDIDHFKKVNDLYGHEVGDLVLQNLAVIMKSILRESDIIARWGGEEFLVFLNETDINAAQKVAEKLRLAVETNKDESLPHYTISIGLVQGNADKTFDELIKEADDLLYKAKEHGRNRVVSA